MAIIQSKSREAFVVTTPLLMIRGKLYIGRMNHNVQRSIDSASGCGESSTLYSRFTQDGRNHKMKAATGEVTQKNSLKYYSASF